MKKRRATATGVGFDEPPHVISGTTRQDEYSRIYFGPFDRYYHVAYTADAGLSAALGVYVDGKLVATLRKAWTPSVDIGGKDIQVGAFGSWISWTATMMPAIAIKNQKYPVPEKRIPRQKRA